MLDVKYPKRVFVETIFWFTLCTHRRESIVEKDALKIEPALLNILLQFDEVLNRWRSSLKVDVEAYKKALYALAP
jgi:hypothetical protein